MAKRYKPEPSHGIGTRCFYGKTITEAKQNAKAAIEAAFTGIYNPYAIQYRNVLCLIYRDVAGWVYRVEPLTPNHEVDRHLEEGKLTELRSFAMAGGNSFEEAVKSATMHLAHWTWQHEDEEGFVPPFLTKDTEQFLSWCRFQRDYKRYKAMGYSDVACHQMACGWVPPPGAEAVLTKGA
jgi:hypothetical protein